MSDESKAYSSDQVAEILERACGKRVTRNFVNRVFRDLYGDQHAPGTGKPIVLTARQVSAFLKYAVVNHNRRPPVPVRKWLKDNGMSIPRMAPQMKRGESREVVKVATSNSQIRTGVECSADFSPAQMRQIERLIQKKISEFAVGTEVSKKVEAPKRIGSSGTDEYRHKYVLDTVRRFVQERTLGSKRDYQSVWSDIYRVFFDNVGGEDIERYKVGLEYRSTLHYIQEQGVLEEFASRLPVILHGLSGIYPVRLPSIGQQGLFDHAH